VVVKNNGEGRERSERPLSLVEAQRQEAFDLVMEALDARWPRELKRSFVSHDKEYALTSVEDCMVAFVQQNREVVEALHQDIVAQITTARSRQSPSYSSYLSRTNALLLFMPSFVLTTLGPRMMLSGCFRPLVRWPSMVKRFWQTLSE
jgi:cell wall assembly regulator SMI1